MKRQKVPIGEKALMARVNRHLKNEQQQVRKAHGGRAIADVGEFYLLDFENTNQGFVLEKDVNLEELAKKLGVLKSWEALEK